MSRRLHELEEQRAALQLKIHRAETGPGRVSLLEVLAALDTAIAEVMEAQTTLQGLGEMGSGAVPALRERPETGNVFTEHMTAATLRDRNRAISRAKSHTPLSEACRAAGLQSKNELAKKLKMSAGSLTAYEKGRLVPSAVRAKIRALTTSKLCPSGFDSWPNPEK